MSEDTMPSGSPPEGGVGFFEIFFAVAMATGMGYWAIMGTLAANPDTQRRHEELASTIESVDLEMARIVDHADLAGTTHRVYAKHAEHVKAILIEDGGELEIWNYCAFSKQHVAQRLVGAQPFMRDGKHWQRWKPLDDPILTRRTAQAAEAQCTDLVRHLDLDPYAGYRSRT